MTLRRLLCAAAAALVVSATGASAQERTWTKVVIGTEGDFAPWNYQEGGKLKGLEIDLAEDLCKRMKLECSFVVQDFSTLIPSLNLGKIDAIMSGMSATDKRAEVIAFSVPYAASGNLLAVLKGSPLERLPFRDEIINLNDEEAARTKIDALKPFLKGVSIGTQASSINAAFLDRYFKGVIEIREYKAVTQHDLDLKAGRLDAIMASYNYVLDAAKKPAMSELEMVGPRFIGGVIGRGSSIGFRKSDVKLKAMFDEALGAAFADGSYKALSMRYFGYDATPKVKF